MVGVAGGICPDRLKRSRFHGIVSIMLAADESSSALLGENRAYLARA
jgi:hypothetical protein